MIALFIGRFLGEAAFWYVDAESGYRLNAT